MKKTTIEKKLQDAYDAAAATVKLPAADRIVAAREDIRLAFMSTTKCSLPNKMKALRYLFNAMVNAYDGQLEERWSQKREKHLLSTYNFIGLAAEAMNIELYD